MLRPLGAGLIILSFALFGAGRAQELRRYSALITALATSVELLRGEIVSRLRPLPEAAEILARTGPAAARGFYLRLSLELEALGEREFSEIWRDCVLKLALRQNEREALTALGRSLGRYGLDEQEAALCRCLDRLGAASIEARERAISGARLCAGLSLSAGALIAIILY